MYCYVDHELFEAQDFIDMVTDTVNFDPSTVTGFNDWLDTAYPTITIIHKEYSPSEILYEMNQRVYNDEYIAYTENVVEDYLINFHRGRPCEFGIDNKHFIVAEYPIEDIEEEEELNLYEEEE